MFNYKFIANSCCVYYVSIISVMPFVRHLHLPFSTPMHLSTLTLTYWIVRIFFHIASWVPKWNYVSCMALKHNRCLLISMFETFHYLVFRLWIQWCVNRGKIRENLRSCLYNSQIPITNFFGYLQSYGAIPTKNEKGKPSSWSFVLAHDCSQEFSVLSSFLWDGSGNECFLPSSSRPKTIKQLW